MIRPLALLMTFALTAIPLVASTQTPWTEGKNYFLINPPLHTSVPAGKIEVTEVFSYACPHCAEFQPVIKQLKAELPPNVVFTLVPASFNPAEDWPMFQRAYVTAEALGIADRAHNGIFDAIWKSGELAVVDQQTNRIKNPAPTIEDAARIYNKLTGTPVAKFLAVSQSFTVDVKMKADDAYILHGQVDSTPTIVVNGKYRLNTESAGGATQVLQLVKYLVAKESH
ncbi:MAG TPA: thiol:disulfide interchange protein DsbA/DsbL [Steroidobacteraceae bacterium]|jgi:thiol:disulfide interchange protein DsbA|nr:thiol:disulfide interchange protein DsbA/DsbL [Steroidobacteraceae bacterium]